MGAFSALVYSMEGLGHWESDAQSSSLANTGLSTLAGMGWQQFPPWWSGKETPTTNKCYDMGDSHGFCAERPLRQPTSTEFGLDCFPPATPNAQVPSVRRRLSENDQQFPEKHEVQSSTDIDDAEPDVDIESPQFRCSLSHSSNWKNTFVHIMAPTTAMPGAQRRSRSVPKDLGASKTDWNATYQAFRFVRPSISEQQGSAKMSICQVSSGAPVAHVAFDQQTSAEFHCHAQEKRPSRNRRCDRGRKGHDAQRQRRSRQVACGGSWKADTWWPQRRCDTWESAVVPVAAMNGAWEEDDCWSSWGETGHHSGSWDGWQQEHGWRMRRISTRSWW